MITSTRNEVPTNTHSTTPPPLDQPEFTAIVHAMIDSEAPRIFAIVEEHGHRLDARIIAWGLAFHTHAELVASDGQARMSLNTAEDALFLLNPNRRTQLHLVWANPHPASGPDEAPDEDLPGIGHHQRPGTPGQLDGAA